MYQTYTNEEKIGMIGRIWLKCKPAYRIIKTIRKSLA